MIKNTEFTGHQIIKLDKQLLKRASFMAASQYALKRGVLPLFVQGVEKWNYPSWDKENNQDNTPDGPRQDGTFDVEGHSWCDVEGFYSPTLLDQVQAFATYIKDVWGFTHILPFRRKWVTRKGFHGFEGFTFAKPYIPVSYIKEAWPFKRVWSSWIWTVESRSVARSDVVDEKVDIKKVKPGKYLEAQAAADAITPESEVDDEITKRYNKLCEGILINKEDPTCILIDERVFPFDMKSGWSDKFICDMILKVHQYFCGVIGALPAPSTWENGNKGFSKLGQRLKGSLEEVKAGHVIPAEHMDTTEERLAKIKERIQNDSSEN